MLKGREEGLRQGEKEGKVLTAKAVELIAEITGLPLEEILKLQSNIFR